MVTPPSLGRMRLSESLKSIKGFDNVMDWLKKVPLVYLPLFSLPSAAFAYGAPPGFDDFDAIHQVTFIQQIIDMNKNFILLAQDTIETAGIHNFSAGISMIVWAACLKVLTSPFYENALKYPT